MGDNSDMQPLLLGVIQRLRAINMELAEESGMIYLNVEKLMGGSPITERTEPIPSPPKTDTIMGDLHDSLDYTCFILQAIRKSRKDLQQAIGA